MAQAQWRLIRSDPLTGVENMSLDEAILDAVGGGYVLPTLRLYSWVPPCLSLGYAQSIQDVDFDALKARDWHFIRRPTGGRAILHTDELTYSVTAPLKEPRVAGSVLDSYRRLSQALISALQQFGLEVQANNQSQPTSATKIADPACFETPSNYEITVEGKKLIGSAQARRKEGVLQHGSLPLSGDLTRIIQVLNYPDAETRQDSTYRLLERATTLEMVLRRQVSLEEAEKAFNYGFEQALNIEFIEEKITPWELSRAGQLATERYANGDWLRRI